MSDKLAEAIERVRAYDCGDWPTEDSIALALVCDAAQRCAEAEKRADGNYAAHVAAVAEERRLIAELDSLRSRVAFKASPPEPAQQHGLRERIEAELPITRATDTDELTNLLRDCLAALEPRNT